MREIFEQTIDELKNLKLVVSKSKSVRGKAEFVANDEEGISVSFQQETEIEMARREVQEERRKYKDPVFIIDTLKLLQAMCENNNSALQVFTSECTSSRSNCLSL